MASSAKRDYYEILGVSRKASPEEVHHAYRRLAKQYHPDRNPRNKQAEEKFKECGEAYEVLRDPERRRCYDQLCGEGISAPEPGSASGEDISSHEEPAAAPEPPVAAHEQPDAPAEPEEARQLRAFHQALVAATPHACFSWALMAVNAGLFAVMVACGVGLLDPDTDKLVAWGADYGPRTLAGQWWRLLTATFIHIGIIHLALNMWALWNVGPFVERLLGNAGFLVLYLLAGLFGSLASVAWNPYIVSAGASGAIFGLFGALVAGLIRQRRQIPVNALARLWKSTLAFVAFNVIYGVSHPGIDNAAHLGGLFTGFLAGLALARPLGAGPRPAAWKRAALVAAAGAALLGAGAAAVPKGAVDYRRELGWFSQEESKAIEAYNSAMDRARSKQLGSRELADVLDKEVAARWREMHRRVSALRGLPRKAPVRHRQVRRVRGSAPEGHRSPD